jgi:hypothetical protein
VLPRTNLSGRFLFLIVASVDSVAGPQSEAMGSSKVENINQLQAMEDAKFTLDELRLEFYEREKYTLEREWRDNLTPRWQSAKEIIESSPHLKKLVLIPKKKNLEEIIKRKHAQIIQNATSELGRWLLKELLKNREMEEYKEIKKWISHIDYKECANSLDEAKTNRVTDGMIAEAKSVPIEMLLNGPVINSKKRYQVLCPIHKERTPSFTVFCSTNTYKCFGCGEGGDSIDLQMKLLGCDFLSAVRSLVATK